MDTTEHYLERIVHHLDRIATALEGREKAQKPAGRYMPIQHTKRTAIDQVLEDKLADHHGEFTMDQILGFIGMPNMTPAKRRSMGFSLSRYGAMQRRTNTQRFYILP
jgi:hypothetical protein